LKRWRGERVLQQTDFRSEEVVVLVGRGCRLTNEECASLDDGEQGVKAVKVIVMRDVTFTREALSRTFRANECLAGWRQMSDIHEV